MPRLIQVDAFTERPFAGNPAAICFLEAGASDEWLQAVAVEMNLSETAFVRRLPDHFELRWFTPKIEVDLCGHATLAAAHAIWEEGLVGRDEVIRFQTRSGALQAAFCDGLIRLDFPATPAAACEPTGGLLTALGVKPVFVGRTEFDFVIVVESEQVVRDLRPDFRQLERVDVRGVMVTASSTDAQYDFVSRFFAPGAGIDEDPVTGSAHCCLGPYWARKLNKRALTAYQASARGGLLHVSVEGDRVFLSGSAVTVLRGELLAPE